MPTDLDVYAPERWGVVIEISGRSGDRDHDLLAEVRL